MKPLKFITAALLSALLAVSCTACGEENKQSSQESHPLSTSGEMSAEGSANSEISKISESPAEDFEYQVYNYADYVEIQKYIGQEKEVDIPKMIEGMPVEVVGERAFENCTSLTSIKIPDRVTEIGSYAFGGCSSLTSVEIPNSVTVIQETAFENWTSDQTIYIKGRSSAPDSWDADWNKGCQAKIVWNA